MEKTTDRRLLELSELSNEDLIHRLDQILKAKSCCIRWFEDTSLSLIKLCFSDMLTNLKHSESDISSLNLGIDIDKTIKLFQTENIEAEEKLYQWSQLELLDLIKKVLSWTYDNSLFNTVREDIENLINALNQIKTKVEETCDEVKKEVEEAL